MGALRATVSIRGREIEILFSHTLITQHYYKLNFLST